MTQLARLFFFVALLLAAALAVVTVRTSDLHIASRTVLPAHGLQLPQSFSSAGAAHPFAAGLPIGEHLSRKAVPGATTPSVVAEERRPVAASPAPGIVVGLALLVLPLCAHLLRRLLRCSLAQGKASDRLLVMASLFAEDDEGTITIDQPFEWKGATKSDFPVWGEQGQMVDMAEPRMFMVERRAEGIRSDSGTVVLLHGFPSMGYSFREVPNHLFAIPGQPYSRVLIPDWPGWGHSDRPQPGPDYSYSATDMLRSLEEMLDRTLVAGEKVTLVVHGWAAPIVLGYVARHPDRVALAVAINPPLTVGGKPPQLPKCLDSFRNPFLAPILAQDPTRWADNPHSQAGLYYPSEQVMMVYRAPFMRDGMAGVAATATIQNLVRPDAMSLMEEWMAFAKKTNKTPDEVPTLLVLGTEDRFAQAPAGKRAESGRFAGFRAVRKVDGAGHYIQDDWPEVIATALEYYLAGER